jgi:PLP dependent protein
MMITENVKRILNDIPCGVQLVAASKGRQPDEVLQAVAAGITIIGENYLQEAAELYAVLGNRVQWHFIGHLQNNKVGKAVRLFDMIETVDSPDLAAEISRKGRELNKIVPVLIEINSGREPQKHGIFPENAEILAREISKYQGIKVKGLMTMGPIGEKGEDLRPFFNLTRRLFDSLKELDLPGIKMEYLSMGMSDSYKTAIEEGANIVRIGTKIFE